MTGLQKGFSPAYWAAAQWGFGEMDINGADGGRDGGVGEAVLQERRCYCQGSTEEFCVVRLCLYSLCCPEPGEGPRLLLPHQRSAVAIPLANANDGRSAHTAICLLHSDRFAG